MLFAVTEGEDKPVKYPTLYDTVDLALITKVDLAEAVGFDLEAARRYIDEVRPGLEVMLSSSRSGQGMELWRHRLEHGRRTALAQAMGSHALGHAHGASAHTHASSEHHGHGALTHSHGAMTHSH